MCICAELAAEEADEEGEEEEEEDGEMAADDDGQCIYDKCLTKKGKG